MIQFYGALAEWWPVLSPVEEYADEAAEIQRVILERRPLARTLLELGSGGGHVARHLSDRFECCLTDLSADMLAMSRRLNPACVHVEGDMRTLDLGRPFDVVLVHDAVDYMTSEADLDRVHSVYERHDVGLFPAATWTRRLEARGFRAEAVTECTTDDRTPRLIFVGHKPAP